MLVGTAASPDEGLEEMPVFQVDEHGVSMVSTNAIAAAARAVAGVPVNAAERSKLKATLLEIASIACSGTGSDCRNAGCCSQPGFQCFEKDKWFATCREHCIPGSLDPTDPPGHHTPWSCTLIGPRTPTAPPLAAARKEFAVRTTQPIVKESGDNGTVTSAILSSSPPKTTPPSLSEHSYDNIFVPATHDSNPLRKASNNSGEVEIVVKVNDSDKWHVPAGTRHMVVLASGRHVKAEVVHGEAKPGRNKALRQPQPHQVPRASANSLGVAVTAAIVAGALITLAIQVGLLRQSHDSKQNEMHLPKATQRHRQPPTARALARMPSRTSTLTEFDVPPHEILKRQKDLTGLVLW